MVETLQGADQGAGAGGEHALRWRTSSTASAGRPASSATRCRSDSLEVEFARHGLLGHPGDLGALPGPLGQQLDDLGLDEGGVDVHDHQPLGPAVEAGGLDGDVEIADGGLGHQLPPEPGRIVGARQVELQAGDGIARQPGDAVDVGAAAGDAGGDGGHGRRPERMAEDGHVQLPAGLRGVFVSAGGHLDVHAEVLGDFGQLGPDLGLVVPDADQHAEHQPAADDDLLHVDDLDVGSGQGPEQRRGHAGPVPPGDGDEEGPVGGHVTVRPGEETAAPVGTGGCVAAAVSVGLTRPSRKRSTETQRAVAPAMWTATSTGGTLLKYWM